MKRCGLRRPVYLVEDYGTDLEKFTIGKEALLTAIHDTQVLDGSFFDCFYVLMRIFCR